MYLGVDVGGTKTLVATFDDGGALLQEQKFPTPQDYSTFLQDLEKAFRNLEVSDLKGAGIAVPGKVDREQGIGLIFGNLPWQNVSLRHDIEAIIGCSLVLENDAKAAGISEAKNVISDFKKVLYVTIGTGIGFAVLTNDVNDLRVDDRGGKSYMVEKDGRQISWESFASGSAIKQEYGKIAGEIVDEESWKAIVHNFAAGLVPLIQTYHPDVVIIGGGVGVHFNRFGHLLEQELSKSLPSMPHLQAAQHPEEAVIYGCYELAKQKHG
jgi:predicted NBD/HSP70 family sugar kinase